MPPTCTVGSITWTRIFELIDSSFWVHVPWFIAARDDEAEDYEARDGQHGRGRRKMRYGGRRRAAVAADAQAGRAGDYYLGAC